MDQYARFWQQVGILREFFDVAVGPYGARPGSLVAPTWAAEQGCLLVRGAHNVDLALRHATRRTDALPRHAHGVTWLPIKEDVAEVMHRMEQDAIFRDAYPRPVTPNHLVTISPVNACPADEPSSPDGSGLRPPLAGGDAGAGVDVLVVDTGLIEDFERQHSWLHGVTGNLRKPLVGEYIRMYYGHGTYIASVLRCMAPCATVTVSNQLRNAGAICEFDLGRLLLEVLAAWQPADGSPAGSRWPDIISLSAGAPSQSPGEPLLGLAELLRQLRGHEETVLVAAAGNDGHTVPFWPAAAAPDFAGDLSGPGLVSVGALREDGLGRACFSNYGDWVSVFASGERLVSAFAEGVYQNVHDRTDYCRYYPDRLPYNELYPHCTCRTAGTQGALVKFHGLARWSGTSFATPIVAGRIAAAMRAADGTRRTSRQAVAHLWRTSLSTKTDAADQVELPILGD